MTARRIGIAGLALGLLAGLVLALALPRTSADSAPGARAQRPALALGATHVRRTGPPLVLARGIGLRLHGRPQVEARVRDPLGGPDWAVRVFRADRVVPPPFRRPGVDPVIGRDLCAQLGRIHRGRFGWLDAAGTFRRTPPQLGILSTCGSRLPDLHGHPFAEVLSTITEPSRPRARVKSTVLWGLGGTAARTVAFRLGGRPFTERPTRHGAFLGVVAGARSDSERGARITYAGGRVVPAGSEAASPLAVTRAGHWELAARAPDPNGGLPYAMLAARARDGGWCTMTGPRLVGDRAGSVDYLLDVLQEVQLAGGGGCSGPGPGSGSAVFHEHAVALTYGGGTGPLPEEGADLGGAGRIARRTQRGTITFGGIAGPGVVAVTLETPRDVRTLIPAGRAHGILAVYDGSFPTGTVKVIARFRDGRTKVETLRDMGF